MEHENKVIQADIKEMAKPDTQIHQAAKAVQEKYNKMVREREIIRNKVEQYRKQNDEFREREAQFISQINALHDLGTFYYFIFFVFDGNCRLCLHFEKYIKNKQTTKTKI